MRIQFLLVMGQDCLSKEEAGELLDQRVHVATTIQELLNSTKNFFKIAGDYLGGECTIFFSMAMWLCHIDRFKR